MINIKLSDTIGEAVVYFIFNDSEIFYNKKLNEELQKQSDYISRCCEFKTEKSEIIYINDYINSNKIIFVPLGFKKNISFELFRKSICRLVKFCNKNNIETISISLPDFDENSGYYLRALAESAIMTSYQYLEYLSDKKINKLNNIYINTIEDDNISKLLKEGISLGLSVIEARNLVNEPSNIQTPLKLSEDVKKLGVKYGFEVEVFDEDKIIELNMEAFYQVSKGSINKPKFIIMRYMNNKDSNEIMGLVGKGVTFDSGGLNLKRGNRFITMKHDMAGGATVIGTMCSIGLENLKINVVAVVAACENLVSSEAYKPGDIINSMAGKTIQINSTDAEGRLTLIDALHYTIKNEKVTKILDIATLTGSARKMFGYFAAPSVSNNNEFYKIFESALCKSDEAIYRVPLIEDALEFMKCDVADYVNSSLNETCGMITSSLFLREFVGEIPWIHIDGAGPLWIEKDYKYYSKGGSGWGCRTLYFLMKELIK